MEITLSRVYNEQDDSDSFRVLADRLWPRGIKKEALALDLWAKDIAPSTLLRQRYPITKPLKKTTAKSWLPILPLLLFANN